MSPVIILYKPPGCTPLEIIEKFKNNHPDYARVSLGYAGRLDPQADGVLVILAGDENKKRKEYEKLDKKYSFEILFGISTDSYDIMGIITDIQTHYSEISEKTFATVVNQYVGLWNQPYPPYSSPRVNGKPLFYWARRNALDTIKIPEKKVYVNTISLLNLTQINSTKLLEIVQERIRIVKGDFRQNEIISSWKRNLNKLEYNFTCARFEISCRSGLYIRSLANDLGKKLHIPTLAYSITRTAVGPYTIDNAIHLKN